MDKNLSLLGGVRMKKALIILNPTSGKEESLHYEQKICDQLCATHDIEVVKTTCEGDAKRLAEKACEERFDTVILVGGDGTVNEGINGIAEKPFRPKVGIVPLGTVNDFARALNIPLSPDEAIKLLGGMTAYADIGKVNNEYFTNVVAIGALPEAVGEVSIEQKTRLGSLAYLIEGAKATFDNEIFTLRLSYDDQVVEKEAILFLMALTNSVGGFSTIADEADVTDGLVHCFVIKSDSTFQTLKIATNMLFNSLKDDENVHYFSTKELYVEADRQLELNVDGDMVGKLPISISVLHRHIEIYTRKTEGLDV